MVITITATAQTAAYIMAAVLFILSLGGLKNQEIAKRAIWYGIIGMGIAIAATVLGTPGTNWGLLVPMVLVAAGIGTVVAMRVQMTAMPQLVAALHSFVGLAAVLIGINANIESSRIQDIRETGGDLSSLTGFAAELAKKNQH